MRGRLRARRRRRPAAARWRTWRWRCCACTRRARGDPVWPGRAYQRFKDAGNMTDRLGALTALVDRARRAGRRRRSQRFHALFRDEALVIDKWFALQARAPEPGRDAARVFARAKALLQHPDFSLQEPEPRAQPAGHAVHASTRRPSTAPTPRATCSGPTACSSSTRINPQRRRAPGARAGPLAPAGRALPQRGARGHRARGRQARPLQRRARDRHARAGALTPAIIFAFRRCSSVGRAAHS